MKTIAFSIRGLLAAVTMIAVGLFALLNASLLWVSVVVSLTLLLFLTALLAIVYRRGEPRSFWVGFAIFGWVYFLSAHTPLGESYHSLLPTHAALEMLHKAVSQQVGAREESPSIAQLRPRPMLYATLPPKPYFDRIGHCVWAWLLALIGGFLARHFYLAQERKSS